MDKIWNLSQFGDSPALLDEYGNSMSYRELDHTARTLYGQLDGRCLVFCLCRNEIGSILGYVSFLNYGAVPVLLNSNLEQELLENLLAVYQPAFLWLPNDCAALMDLERVYEAYGFCLLKTRYGTRYPLYDQLALLLTTSGSTGSPKFVRQSYRNVLDNAQSIVRYLELDETERPITTLPMNYTYGLSIINSHLLVGAEILVTEKSLTQRDFWMFFRQAGATSFGGVPYTYEILDKLRFCRMELPSLRTMTQAGGKILPELHEKFARCAAEKGRKFVVMYGQCEATARMGYLPPEAAVEKTGSMGIAIPGGRFYLLDENGQRVTMPHTTGELIYEGKNVTLGYAECGEDLKKGDERNGVLETGDMAQFDEDGYYYIVGRKKRFLKIYGNRVNLDEIDRMILSAWGVEAASTGVDDHMYIFVTQQETEEAIRHFVADKTRLNPAAINVIWVPELPRNDAGKTLYQDLTQYYET